MLSITELILKATELGSITFCREEPGSINISMHAPGYHLDCHGHTVHKYLDHDIRIAPHWVEEELQIRLERMIAEMQREVHKPGDRERVDDLGRAVIENLAAAIPRSQPTRLEPLA